MSTYNHGVVIDGVKIPDENTWANACNALRQGKRVKKFFWDDDEFLFLMATKIVEIENAGNEFPQSVIDYAKSYMSKFNSITPNGLVMHEKVIHMQRLHISEWHTSCLTNNWVVMD